MFMYSNDEETIDSNRSTIIHSTTIQTKSMERDGTERYHR